MLLNRISQSFQKYSGKNAFCIEDSYYTYRQLALTVSKIRKQLELISSGNSKLVGIIDSESNEFYTYASIFGALFAGFGYVPINPKNPLDRNNSVIQQAEITTILTTKLDDYLTELANINNLNIIVTPELPEVEIDYSIPDVSEDEIAYVLFTSGSTGVPKGVPIKRKNVTAFINSFFAIGYQIDEKDRFIQMFDLTFDLSVMCYLVPLYIGACVYPVSNQGVKYANVFNILLDYKITFALMVPSILTYLRNYFDEIHLNELKYSLFCGEAFLNDIAREWSVCVPNALIQNVYGPTEATIFCLTFNLQKGVSNPKNFNGILSIGKAMNGMEAIVIDEHTNILNQSEKGELCLSGRQLTSGYINNPEKNKSAFFKKLENGIARIYYRTGDLAFFDDAGDFMYCGRIDTQVKIDGFRVELSEIEFHAREFTKCIGVAAIDYLNKIGLTKIHLFLENYSGDLKELENYLVTKIPTFMVPSSISSLPFFPLNVNGKIDRKKLNEVLFP